MSTFKSMWKILISIFFILCGHADASQLTAASNGKDAPKQNTVSGQTVQNSQFKLQGTKENPIFVKNISLPDSEDSIDHKNYENYEKPMLERWLTWSTVALAVSTFLLFCFTAALWYVTYRLSVDARETGVAQASKMEQSIAEATRATTAMENIAEATRNNASLMQGILHKQMRAYVAVDIGTCTYQDEKLRFESAPILSNTGFTPARNVSFKVMADILDTNLPQDFKFTEISGKQINDAGLSPRQQFVIHGVVKNRFPDAEVAEIMEGKNRRLYVWGSVTYDDIFGGSWETHFCHHHVFFRVGETWQVNGFYHHTHNSAT